MKRRWFHEIDLAAKQLLEIHLQPSQIDERAPGLELNQEIDVACRTGIAAGYRAEDAKT